MKILVNTYFHRWSADTDKAILNESGIECWLEGYNTDPQFNQAIGGIKLFVDKQDYDLAHRLIIETPALKDITDANDNIKKGIKVCSECGCKSFYSNRIPLMFVLLPVGFFCLLIDLALKIHILVIIWTIVFAYTMIKRWEEKCVRCKKIYLK